MDNIYVCPQNLIRISGTEYDAAILANKLKKNSDILNNSGGGITLTGGEVLAQPVFLLELLNDLNGLHRAIETSGYGSHEVFINAISKCELVIMDIKAVNDDIHTQYTGVSNKIILKNLELLKESEVPFIIRIPLIPGVNDTSDNLLASITLAANSKNLVKFELLPYNKMAGAKYAMLGLDYNISFDQNKHPNFHEYILKEHNIPYNIL